MPRSPLLAYDLVRTLGARRVLDGISLTAAPGQRIGLIGENGAGKSALLRLLAGADEPDAGTVVRPPDTGFLHQEMPFDPATAVAGAFLEAQLRDLPGAIVLASHDRAFLDAVCTDLIDLDPALGGTVRRQLLGLPGGQARRAGALGAPFRRRAGGTRRTEALGRGHRPERRARPRPARSRQDGVRPPDRAGGEADLEPGPRRHPAAG